MPAKSNLKQVDNRTLLNYIISENPELSAEIDLVKQGEDVKKIGQLIVNNKRYRNAFLNTVNVLAVDLIKGHDYQNPWEAFTDQGEIEIGSSVREMVIKMVEGQDYNEKLKTPEDFIKNEVPEILSYIHDINFQKFYKTTVSVAQMSLAFNSRNGLYNLVEKIYGNLRKSFNYDKYCICKYMLQRRLVDGTVPAVTMKDFDTNTARDNIARFKEESNNMTFMSPNYNPSAYEDATDFEYQRAIISTGFEAQMSTNVLATSFFKDEAEMKSKLSMIDGFAKNNYARLAKLLGNDYQEFTAEEKAKLEKVVGMIIADDFFTNYRYAIDSEQEFTNPQTLERNMWLHIWMIFDTSPYANAVAFTKEESAVGTVTVAPKTASVTKGQELQFTADVKTSGLTNKSVYWTIDEQAAEAGVTINQFGKLTIPKETSVSTVTVTATSVYSHTQTGTATVTIVTA